MHWRSCFAIAASIVFGFSTCNADYKFSVIDTLSGGLSYSSLLSPDGSPVMTSNTLVQVVQNMTELKPVAGDKWICTPATYNGNAIEIMQVSSSTDAWAPFINGAQVGRYNGNINDTEIEWGLDSWIGGAESGITLTATRSIGGYAMASRVNKRHSIQNFRPPKRYGLCNHERSMPHSYQ